MNKIKTYIIKTGIPKKIVEVYTRRQYKKMIKEINIGEPKKILDVGGSSGIFAKILKEKTGSNDYAILEIDPIKIKEGKEKNPQIKFVKGNAEKMSFSSKSFDLVVCKDVLHHCENPLKAVKEIKRVGKKYLIIEARRGDKWLDHFLKEHNHFTEEKFKEIVKPQKMSYLDILWPCLAMMIFLIFLPKIPKSKKAFMVGQN